VERGANCGERNGSERAQGRERSGEEAPASPCAEWLPVPGYAGGGSVRQAIYETLH